MMRCAVRWLRKTRQSKRDKHNATLPLDDDEPVPITPTKIPQEPPPPLETSNASFQSGLFNHDNEEAEENPTQMWPVSPVSSFQIDVSVSSIKSFVNSMPKTIFTPSS